MCVISHMDNDRDFLSLKFMKCKILLCDMSIVHCLCHAIYQVLKERKWGTQFDSPKVKL